MKKLLPLIVILPFLNACSPDDSKKPTTQDVPSQTTQNTSTVKSFVKTPQDAKDIETLSKFNQNFIEMSTEMHQELQQLKAQGNLREDFVLQRKKDQTMSALNMLKDLELHTPQGHYIQGMLYDYWEQQHQFLTQPAQHTAPNKGIVLQAETQLAQWKKTS